MGCLNSGRLLMIFELLGCLVDWDPPPDFNLLSIISSSPLRKTGVVWHKTVQKEVNWEQKVKRLTGVSTAEFENSVFTNTNISLHTFTLWSLKYLQIIFVTECTAVSPFYLPSHCTTILLCTNNGFHIKQTILRISDLEIVAGCPDRKNQSPVPKSSNVNH